MTEAVASDVLSSAGSKRGSSALSRNENPSKRSSSLHGCHYEFLGHRSSSVLHHPIGVPLTYSFMEPTAPAVDGEQQTGLPNELFNEFSDENLAGRTGSFIRPDLTSFDDIFQTSYDAWLQLPPNRRHEAQLTSRLVRSMRTQLNRYNLHVHGQEVIPDELTGGTGNLDISVHANHRSNEGGNSTPLLIVEFGFGVELWWKKFDQGVCYVTNHPRFQESEAVLLAVVTTEKATLTRTTGTSRLGVFLVTPKQRPTKNNDYRISLLWHKEANGLSSLSQCFGKLLRATCRLPAMKDVAKAMIASETYECLGPNCCMIKVKEEKVKYFFFPFVQSSFLRLRN
jgi:hypothetical protein